MAEKPKSAADYLAQAAANTKAVRTKRPTTPVSSKPFVPTSPSGVKSGETQSPLNWLMDIVTRPLSGVTNVVSKGVDRGIDINQTREKGDIVGSLLKQVQAGASVGGDFLEGLTTNDVSKHRTFSQVIEQSTDKIGTATDPGYVDRKDNVDPWVKGIGGFAGDVALDPLSWIPGVAFLNAGKAVSKGVNAVAKSELAKGISKATKTAAAETAARETAEKATKVAEKAETKTPEATPEAAVVSDAGKMTDDVAEAEAVGVPAEVPDVTAALLAKYTAKDLDEFRQGEKLANTRTQLGEFKETGQGFAVRKGTAPEAVYAATKVTLDDAKRFNPAWMNEADDLLQDTPMPQQPPINIGGKSVPFTVAVGAATRGDKAALAALRAFHSDTYGIAFNAGMKTGHHVDALGRAIDPKEAVSAMGKVDNDTLLSNDLAEATTHRDLLSSDPAYAQAALDDAISSWDMTKGAVEPLATDVIPTAKELKAYATAIALRDADKPTIETLLADAGQEVDILTGSMKAAVDGADTVVLRMASARETFQKKFAEDQAGIRARIGDALTDHLKKSGYTDQRFDNIMSKLNEVLDNGLDFASMKKLDTAVDKMLRNIGMDVNRIEFGQNKLRSVAATVPPPKTMEELAAKGGQAVVDEVVIAAKHAMGIGAKKDIIDVKTTHPFLSPKGARKTKEQYGKGTANVHREVGTHNQATFFYDLIRSAGAAAKTKKLAGAAAASFKSDYTIAALRLIERAWDEHGVPLVLALPKIMAKTVANPDRIILGQSQFLDILNGTSRDIVRKSVFNQSSAVAMTNLSDAVYVATKSNLDSSAIRTQVEYMIRQDVTPYTKGTDAVVGMRNNIVNTGPLRYGGGALAADDVVRELVDAIMKSVPAFKHQAAENAIAFEKRIHDETLMMTDQHLQVIEDAFSDGTIGDWVTAVTETGSRLAKDAKELGITQQAEEIATIAVASSIPDVDKAVSTAANHAVDAQIKIEVAAGKSGEEAYSVAQSARRKEAAADGQKIIQESQMRDPGDLTRDLGDNILDVLGRSFYYKMLLKVNRSQATGAFHGPMRRAEGMWRDMVGRSAQNLNDLHQLWSGPGMDSRALWKEAMRAIQTGTKPSTPIVVEHIAKLEILTAQMFGKAGGATGKAAERVSMLDNKFFLGNTAMPHMNAVFSKYNLGKSINKVDGETFRGFDLDAAAEKAAVSGRSLMVEAADQWKTWDIADPAEFVNTAYTSLAKITADQSIAASLLKLLNDTPGSYSTTPKAGFSRVTNDSNKSILASYIDGNTYIRNDILDQVHAVDNYMQQTLQLGENAISVFVKNIYRPAQDIWKAGMTLPNPTHHIRNMVSDLSLTGLAEGYNVLSMRAVKDAFHVIGTRGGYSNWDAIAALQSISEVPNVGKIVGKTRHGDVRADEIYREMADRGLLPNFRTLETLEDDVGDATGRFAERWREVQNTKGMKVLGGVSEARDHYARLHHVLVILQKEGMSTKFKSKIELYDYAAQRVRKWHPDGSDLTSTEQAFKLLIPFYSWQRKTIPLIVESLLTNPARVTVVPKAQYAIATGMGVDPESLADPFPDDQMFPSYMTDQGIVGPITKVDGKYYGINPGFAANDVLSDYVGLNPVETLIASTSPLIRAPFEMATGAKVGGARINDYSDYVDSSLPGVSVLARITGNSVTGSAGSLVQGKGLDQQYPVREGNKVPGEGLTPKFLGGNDALTNWLLGPGITDMSMPNAQNYAELEKRNREKAAKEGNSAF